VLEHELHEPLRLRELGRLADEVSVRDAATCARHPGEVETCTAGSERVVRLSQPPGAEPCEVVEHGVAQELHAVAGEEERHVVTLLESGLADEEAERRARRVLRAAGHMDEDLRHGAIVEPEPCEYLGRTLEARLQICGRLVATVDGRRIEAGLPGRQGRLLFVYLVCNRLREVGRDELTDALWHEPPAAADSALSALMSKLRRILPIEGRSELRLMLPRDAFVDYEAAEEAIHRAESAVRLGYWVDAWAPSRVALHTATRGFLPGEDAPWIEERSRRLEDVRLRAQECVAAAGVGLGGAELDSALRAGRALVELAPFRESGHRLLMQALAADGNPAEAIAVYDALRVLLRDELGTAPARQTQDLYRTLLG
jgi:DNA-binding SARP family transcriptional activator